MPFKKLNKFDINFDAGDAYKAEIRINQLLKLGCRVDNATISSLISLYGKKRKLTKAQEIFTAFADSPLAKKLLCNSMLDAYAKCGKSEEAYFLYKQLTEEGHDLDAVAISIVVNALTHSGMNLDNLITLKDNKLSENRATNYCLFYYYFSPSYQKYYFSLKF